MSESNGSDLKVFSTGAVRSRDADGAAFTLISPIAQQAEAEVLAKGDIKYGTYNWEKGMPVRECLEHAMQHINKYLEGERDEPHLAHARTNLGFAIHSEAMWPDLNTDLRREGCIPPNVSDEKAAERANLRANLEAMKAGVKAAAEKADDIREGDVLYMDRDGVIKKYGRLAGGIPGDSDLFTPAGPAEMTAYHILPIDGMEQVAATCRSDLQFEGHVVVSGWIDGEGAETVNESNLIAADVLIVLKGDSDDGVRFRVDRARQYGKPIVVIGPCPPDFPRLGTGERWFPSWPSFLQHLADVRLQIASSF